MLRAKALERNGIFAAVTYIVRTNTTGGLAASSGCNQEHSGTEVRIDYSATHTFFSG